MASHVPTNDLLNSFLSEVWALASPFSVRVLMNFNSMNNPFPRALPFAALLVLSSCASSQAQPPVFPTSSFNRVLIVSGGPNARYTQYAIESNARYVGALTRGAKWRRVLFADGKAASRTVSTVVDTPRTRARAVASWVWGLDSPTDAITVRTPTLAPISGSSSSAGIQINLHYFASSSDSNERQLVYFTGHGAPGSDFLGHEDFKNTVYAAWNDDSFSTRQLARALQRSKSQAPLVLVMVQCHSGGFANVMFQNGDPSAPVWNRDFCGFFASTPDRQASGCTEQVNERDYQDFTTHFFAALSGTSRDGRAISGADYDGDGHVSLDEAYDYAQINDNSIDVPLCTSDAFLRVVFPRDDKAWQKTGFGRLLKTATPGQRAVLDALSAKLKLSGDNRVRAAQAQLAALGSAQGSQASSDWQTPAGVDEGEFNAAYARLKNGLNERFPRIQTLRGAAKTSALAQAITFLTAQKSDLDTVYDAYQKSLSDSEGRDVQEARLLRFLRCARSITLEQRLKREATPAQKAVFARLRTSESRSAF